VGRGGGSDIKRSKESVYNFSILLQHSNLTFECVCHQGHPNIFLDDSSCNIGVPLTDNVDSKAFSSANICDTCDVLLTDSRARSDFLCAKNVAKTNVEAGQKKPRRSAGLRAGRGGAGGDNNTTALGVSMGDRSANANQARSGEAQFSNIHKDPGGESTLANHLRSSTSSPPSPAPSSNTRYAVPVGHSNSIPASADARTTVSFAP
jgi:hypothetical protein